MKILKTSLLAFASASVLVMAMRSQADSILIDFGAASGTGGPTTGQARFWNNITTGIGFTTTVGTNFGPGASLNLTNTAGVPSGATITVVRSFALQNQNGLASGITNQFGEIYPGTATAASLYGNTENFNGTSNVWPELTISGLNPSTTYTFKFYASRQSNDHRDTRYTLAGATTNFADLNPGQNGITNVAVVVMTPDANGNILYDQTNAPANTQANHFTYLGVMQIDYVSADAPAVGTQPVSKELYAGRAAQFTVGASGGIPLSYFWRTNGVIINDGGNVSGSRSNVLTISNISATNAADYDVVVTNFSGSVTSSVATLIVAAPTLAYERTVLADAPAAYYRLNETNGDPQSIPNLPAFNFYNGIDGVYGTQTANSSSGLGIFGPQPSDGYLGFEAGNGAALFYHGLSSRISAPAWNISGNSVTLSAWVYPTTSENANNGLVMNRGVSVCGLTYSGSTDGNGNYTLGYNWNNEAGSYSWSSGLVPPANQWSLVVLSVTPSDATIYLINVNGTNSATHAYSHVPQTFSGPIQIGADPTFGGVRVFDGEIDEVAAFNHAMSPSEVLSLFAAAQSGVFVPPGPVGFTSEPVSQQILQARPATFSCSVTGTPPFLIQWRSNSVPISGANQLTYTIPNVTLSMNGVAYSVTVSNGVYGALSTNAILSVIADNNPPVLLSGSGAGGFIVNLQFNETLDPSSATNLSNYSVSGGSVAVTGAVLSSDGQTVRLRLGTGVVGSFPVTVSHVKDSVGNEIALNSTVTVNSHGPQVTSYLFDFGSTDTTHGPSPNDPVNYWNNVSVAIGTSASGQLNGVVASDNSPTPISLVMQSVFSSVNTGGTTNSTIFPINATSDSLFGNTELFNGIQNTTPKFKLAGLSPFMTYSFTFYASRTLAGGDIREAVYTVTGANTDSAALDASENADNVATVNGIAPTAQREISISLTPSANNNNSVHFVYLGVMKVVATPGPLTFSSATVDNNHSLTLNWAGGGELEWAPAITGPWAPVSPSPFSPYSESATNDSRFFRLNSNP